MNESGFSREIRKALEAHRAREGFETSFYVRKIVQGAMTSTAGIPDLIGCMCGRFVAIECKFIKRLPKTPKGKLGARFTNDQVLECQRIIAAGGMACGLVCIHEQKRALIVPVVSMNAANDYTLGDLPDSGDEFIRRKHSEWDVTKLVEYLSH